jgi:hypothetical protein
MIFQTAKREYEMITKMYATLTLPLELELSLLKNETRKQAPMIAGIRRSTAISTNHQWM